MVNDLAIPQTQSLAPKYTDEDVAGMSTGGDYLPRLQLIGSNSGLAKEDKIAMGRFALITDNDNFKDLDKQVDVLVCSWRFKAMEIGEDSVISVFDPTDPEFKRIRALSDVSDSGCMCGFDFLLWLPTEHCFAILYMASKSAKREVPKLRTKINEEENKPGPATLTISLVKTKKYSWHVIKVQDCTVVFDLPEIEAVVTNVQKFQNPPKNEVEEAAAPERAR